MVVVDDPNKYPSDAQFAPDTDVWHRDRLDEAQRLLRDIEGCTVLIYDQACAAELRRDRKRGKVAEPKTRVFINEAVCEGCGDCGEKSSCLSVQPVETEFGRKTQIHQSSCNKDFTCLDGDCPAFIEVVPGGKVPTKATAAVDEIGDDLPEPDRLDEGNILMMGIGGTGVVTVNQMLATAALLDGKQANGLDQTGLAQKGGPVVSNLKVRRFGSTPDEGDAGGSNEAANKVGVGEADAYIVFDLLSGTNPVNLEKAQAGRTVALVSSSKVPTSAMVRDTAAEFPEWTAFQRSIDDATTPERNVYFDAGTLSDNLFRSHMPANVLVLGAAYQSGVVPISATAIERAIELNGVAVEMNTQAFRIGRKIVLDPDFLATLHVDRVGRVKRDTGPSKREQKLIDSVADPSEELARLLRIRVPDLVAYQSIDYAADYASFVAQVRESEAAVGDSSALSESVARYLYKLMAYKDEYEVARLHRSKAFQQAVRNQFGDKTDVTYKLHPPIMRRMGVQRKIGLGRSGDVAFAVLARMKGFRGGTLDVFGKTAHRRMERELIDEYRGMISRTLDTLARGDDAAYARAVEIRRAARHDSRLRGHQGSQRRALPGSRRRTRRLIRLSGNHIDGSRPLSAGQHLSGVVRCSDRARTAVPVRSLQRR